MKFNLFDKFAIILLKIKQHYFFFLNKAEAFRKNYSIISAKYVHVKNTTFIYKKLLQYEI